MAARILGSPRDPIKGKVPYSIPDDPLAHLPFPLRLRSRIEWWKKNGKDRDVVRLIQCGVCPCWSHPPDLPWMDQSRNVCDQKAALEILPEYLEIGAVRKVSMAEVKFLVPWFVIRKPEGDGVKLRLISDCRKINNFLSPSHFKLDHWQNIFPFLRKGMWACKVDLKHAYFHLGVGDELKPYLCVKVGDEVFQFQAACFGLSTLPQIWMTLMKVFQRKWRSKGLLVFIYLDDIFVVGDTQTATAKAISVVVKDLIDSGMLINHPKSE